MSGPKVVRIVTPQERKLIKQRWLTQLKSKIAQVKTYATKHNMFTEALNNALEETLRHYQNISEDNYEKIEQEVPNQLKFLENEKKNLVKKVVKIRTSKWESFKNLKSTHNELRFLLKKKNIAFQDFESPTNPDSIEIEVYSKKVDHLYKLLGEASIGSQKLTDEQTEIQQRLSAGYSFLSVQEWQSKRPKSMSRLKKLENTLKEMYLDEIPQHKIKEFMDRCGQLDKNNPKYDLLLDSLTIEAAEFNRNYAHLKENKENLKIAIEQLENLESEMSFIHQWKTVLQSDNLVEIKETLEKAHRLYDEISENIIVETRRSAIKKALKEAGYEVNDSMEIAWVENGRLVVKKTKNSLYGIEFMSPQNLSRIQARVVADENRSHERSPSLDKNQEEIWCDEFDDIKTILENENLSIIVDKMHEPGEIKLKEVALNEGYARNSNKAKKDRLL